MNKLVELAPDLAVAIVSIGLLGYLIALVLAAFFSGRPGSMGARLAGWFTAYPAQNLGGPSAALSAFAIVSIFMKLFPSQSDSGSEIQLKVFSLNSAGPLAPSHYGGCVFLNLLLLSNSSATPSRAHFVRSAQFPYLKPSGFFVGHKN